LTPGRVIAPTYRQPEAVLDVVKDASRRLRRWPLRGHP
jgi:hypothetical protein